MEILQSITIRFPKRILLQITDVIPNKYQNISIVNSYFRRVDSGKVLGNSLEDL